ncbi:late embryogenesis abundant protein, LEA5, partial [Tanacetum coccineum]
MSSTKLISSFVVVASVSGSVNGSGIAMMKKATEDSKKSTPWVPDRITGYYKPEGQTNQVDAADQIYELLLKQKNRHVDISRRGIDIDSISCGNCDLGVKTSNHLFFTCDMAKQITRLIMRWWDVPELEIDSYNDWRNWIVNVRMPSKNKD